MNEGFFKMERPENEPCKLYKAGSPEQIALMAEVEKQSQEVVEIPVIINGKEIFTDDVIDIVEPHNHQPRDRPSSPRRRERAEGRHRRHPEGCQGMGGYAVGLVERDFIEPHELFSFH